MRIDTNRGFTLVELLVVIAIIAILIALLLPAVQAARDAARRTQNSNNLKQIELALQSYEDIWGAYPVLRFEGNAYSVSWSFRLLPYLEQQAMFDSHNHRRPAYDPVNSPSMRSPVSVFVNPMRRVPVADRPFDNNGGKPLVRTGGAAGDYAGNRGAPISQGGGQGVPPWSKFDPTIHGPLLDRIPVRMVAVSDGTSLTFAVGDRWIPLSGHGTKGSGESQDTTFYSDTAFFAADSPYLIGRGIEGGFPVGQLDPSGDKFGAPYGSLTAFTFFDGHVTWLSHSMSLTVYQSLSIIGDGHTISANDF